MTYQVSGLVYVGFSTTNSSGAATNADSTPTAALYKNGTLDGSVTVSVSNTATGAYSCSFTVPSGYSVGDDLQLLIAAVIGGTTVRAWIGQGTVDATINSRAVAGDAMALSSGERTTLAGVIWNYLTASITLANSIGKQIKDNLDAAVSSRSDYSIGDIWDEDTGTGTARTNLEAIKSKTAPLPASPAATGDIPSASVIADAVISTAPPSEFFGSMPLAPTTAEIATAVADSVPPAEFFTNAPSGGEGGSGNTILRGPFGLRIDGDGPDGATGLVVYTETTPTLRLRAITESGEPIPMLAPVVGKLVNNATGATVADDIATTAITLSGGQVSLQVPSAATLVGMAGKRLKLTLSWTDGSDELIVVGGVTLEITAP